MRRNLITKLSIKYVFLDIMEKREELQIVQDILNGNKERFREIVGSCSEPLFRVAMGYMHNREEAEDIVQEVFIKAYNSLDSFKGESKILTWLYRFTVNSCINELNRKKRRWFFPATLLSVDKNPEEEAIDKERDLLVKKAIETLPSNQKTAFILQRYQDMTQKEIAEIMEITEGAVEQLLQRGKITLRKKLQNIKG